jgi:hypothetical protein
VRVGNVRVYIACGVTDMRKGFDTLAAQVQTMPDPVTTQAPSFRVTSVAAMPKLARLASLHSRDSMFLGCCMHGALGENSAINQGDAEGKT